MRRTAISFSLAGLVLLGGCASSSPPSRPAEPYTAHQDLAVLCQTFELLNESENIGTGFFYALDAQVFSITAAHVLLLNGTTGSLYLRPACSKEKYKVQEHQILRGLDLVILVTDKDKIPEAAGIIGTPAPPLYGEEIFSPNLSNVQKIEPRFKGQFIPSTGRFIKNQRPTILFTMDILYPGASGAPIVNKNSRLVGMITNRVVDKNTYTGLGFGIMKDSIDDAIRSHIAPR